MDDDEDKEAAIEAIRNIAGDTELGIARLALLLEIKSELDAHIADVMKQRA